MRFLHFLTKGLTKWRGRLTIRTVRDAVCCGVLGLGMSLVANGTASRAGCLENIGDTLLIASGDTSCLLYNGVRLPAIWPPQDQDPASTLPMRVPYLENPPEIINIDVGRQLFVDDFLVEETTLDRVFHQAEKWEGN